MKKLSVSEAVLNNVKNKGSMTTKELVKTVNKPPNQVYTAVWKLVQAGKLSKLGKTVKLGKNLPAMTALKPNVPFVVDKISGVNPEKINNIISKRKATGSEMSMGKKINSLEIEIETLKRDLAQMSVNYYDALAVIKYLENKAKG